MSQIQVTQSAAITAAGQAANAVAGRHAFTDYRGRKSQNTRDGHDNDLILFGRFLHETGISVELDFATDPNAWVGMTWGLVSAFRLWMLQSAYAVGSINRALSTLKVYAKLAMQAGAISTEEYALMRSVKGYSKNEAYQIDEQRDQSRKMRDGKPIKKADFIVLDADQIRAMKDLEGFDDKPTGQARMLRLMMCLFLDHGLRCSEMAELQVANVDRKRWTLTFFRPKTKQWETHRLERDTRQAMKAYLDSGDAPAIGYLFRKTIKNGALGEPGMSTRALTAWVNKLGKCYAGLDNLSAHDGRHTWATRASEHGTDTLVLMQAGGWTSPSMPARYVKRAKITNEGVNLGDN